MEKLWQDIRYGLRMLVQSRAYTLIAITVLALGTGANSAIFSVVNTVLFKPLPFAEANRLMVLLEKSPQFELMAVSFPNYLDWRDQNHSFEQLAAFRIDSFNLTGVGEPEELRCRMTTANLFPLLRVQTALGRTFLPEEDQPGANPTVILSHGLWQRLFGGETNVVGRQILLNDRNYTVVGVMPRDFQFFSNVDIFVPLQIWGQDRLEGRGNHRGIYAIGRLKKSVTIEQARIDMETIAANLSKQYPDTNANCTIHIDSLIDFNVRDIKSALWLLLASVGLVLVIACANVANLLLARAAARQKEIAVRIALGASRWRIIRQLLTESLMLSLMGGVSGLLVAFWSLDFMVGLSPGQIPRLEQTHIDGPVLLFTFFISVGTGVIFGMAPAWQYSQPNLNETLKESGAKQTGQSHSTLRRALVVSEIALAFTMLVGAGLLMRSFLQLVDADPGFNPDNILTMQVNLPEKKYDTPEKIVSFHNSTIEQLKALPGVETVAITDGLPFLGGSENSFVINDGRPKPTEMPFAVTYTVTPNYFKAMQITLVKGRLLEARDNRSAPAVMVIDENFAKRYFPDQDPIGKQVTEQDGTFPREIVGVVRHVAHSGLDAEPSDQSLPQFYISNYQIPKEYFTRGLLYVIRTTSEPLALASIVRGTIQSVDKDQPVSEISSMSKIIDDSLGQRRYLLMLLAIFALLALMLAVVGIYGVMSYEVAQRTREIGVRMALGASPRDVLKLVMAQGLWLIALGVGGGLLASLAFSRLIKSLVFGVSVYDPITFSVLLLLLSFVAMLACYVPARRAMRVDPMVALKCE